MRRQCHCPCCLAGRGRVRRPSWFARFGSRRRVIESRRRTHFHPIRLASFLTCENRAMDELQTLSNLLRWPKLVGATCVEFPWLLDWEKEHEEEGLDQPVEKFEKQERIQTDSNKAVVASCEISQSRRSPADLARSPVLSSPRESFRFRRQEPRANPNSVQEHDRNRERRRWRALWESEKDCTKSPFDRVSCWLSGAETRAKIQPKAEASRI